MNQTTHPDIIKLIVRALVAYVGFYLLVQGVCIVCGINPPESLSRGFDTAGNVLIGMLGGLLMRTASMHDPATSTTTQTTQTTIKTEPEKDKDPTP